MRNWSFPAANALTTDSVIHNQILTSLSIELSNIWKEIDELKQKRSPQPFLRSGEN